MKNIILILLLAVSLSSCFPDDYAGCPDYMTLSFQLEDKHVDGDYDSRIGNKVLLLVFKNGRLSTSMEIPYAEIQSGKEYTLLKTDQMSGNLDMVFWAVPPSKTSDYIPSYNENCSLEDHCLSMEPFTRATTCTNPDLGDIYLGTVSTNEPLDQPTKHKVSMIHAGCRVTVNVTDLRSQLGSGGKDPRVCVDGTMTRMNTQKQGTGSDAAVHVDLNRAAGSTQEYSTGLFSVLPSTGSQTLSVTILNGNDEVATLTVPRDNLARGAQAGDLMVFDYVMGQSEFYFTVNGFRQVIKEVSM